MTSHYMSGIAEGLNICGWVDFFFRFNILIFIHLFKYETIETHARAFLPLNISAVGSVPSTCLGFHSKHFGFRLFTKSLCPKKEARDKWPSVHPKPLFWFRSDTKLGWIGSAIL